MVRTGVVYLAALLLLPVGAVLAQVTSAGPIDALDAGSITVAGRTWAVNAETQVFDEAGSPIPYANLQVGQHAEVIGIDTPDGLVAETIEQLSPPPPDDSTPPPPEEGSTPPVVADGPIDALSATSITVGGLTFDVTETTQVSMSTGEALGFEDLQVGWAAHVEGEHDAAGILVAHLILADPETTPPPPEGEPVFTVLEGTIEAIDAGSITVAGTLVNLADFTEAFDETGAPLAVADLAVGTYVWVEAEVHTDGSHTALRIALAPVGEDPPPGEGPAPFVVEGAIEAIDATYITVAGETFAITAETDVSNADGTPASLADLAVGDFVVVDGYHETDGSLIAVFIRAGDATTPPPPEGEPVFTVLEGTIEAIDAGSITVAGTLVNLADFTEAFDETGAPLAVADLAVGTYVWVEAEVHTDGSHTALRIALAPVGENPPPEGEPMGVIEGELQGFDGTQVVVAGEVFTVTETTEVVGPDGARLALSDLVAGTYVALEYREETATGMRYAEVIFIGGFPEEPPPPGEEPQPHEEFAEGPIEALDTEAGTLTVAGQTFRIVFDTGDGTVGDGPAPTLIVDETGQPLAWSDLAVDDYVLVDGYREADGHLVAARIQRGDPNNPPPPGEGPVPFVVEGTIEAIDATHITVGGKVFLTDGQTHYLGPDGAPTEASTLTVGAYVWIEVIETPDGVLALLVSLVPFGEHPPEEGRFVVEGEIEALDTASLTVAGHVFQVADFTEVYDETGARIAVADLSVGTYVWLEAEEHADGSLTVLRISLAPVGEPPPPPPPGEGPEPFVIEGEIDALDREAGWVKIAGDEVHVDDKTQYHGVDGEPADVTALAIGAYVWAEVVDTPDGLLAIAVSLAPPGSPPPGEAPEVQTFEGAIEALEDGALTVAGTVFRVDRGTMVFDEHGIPSPFDILIVGQFVAVDAFQDEGGAWVALGVFVGGFPDDPPPPPGEDDPPIIVEGAIEALEAGTLTVAGTTFVLTDSTQTFGEDGPFDLSTLAVGTYVWVGGFEDETGTLVAVGVSLVPPDAIEPPPGPEPSPDMKVVEGPIEATDGVSITVQGQTFLIKSVTVIVDETGVPVGRDVLAVGQVVVVEGFEDPQGDLVAAGIFIGGYPEEPPVPADVIEHGPIESLYASSFTVRGVTFVVDSGTEIRGEDGSTITFFNLQKGMFVWVKGDHDEESGSLIAEVVEVRPAPEEPTGLRPVGIEGPLQAATDTSLTVQDRVFATTDSTRVEDEAGAPITLSDIAVGTVVAVGGFEEGGRLVALGVFVGGFPEGVTPPDDDGADPSEPAVEITEPTHFAHGPIEERGWNSLAVGGRMFFLLPETEARGLGGAVIDIATLDVGRYVEVAGFIGPDGHYYAVVVREAHDPAEHPEPTVFANGPIEAVDGVSVTVEGTAFTIEERTDVFDRSGTPLTAADLAVGVFVHVDGFVAEDGVTYALLVVVGEPDEDDTAAKAPRVVKGYVKNLTLRSFQIGDLRVDVPRDVTVLDTEGASTDFTAVGPGDYIEVTATEVALGVLAASQVRILAAAVQAPVEDEAPLDPVVIEQEGVLEVLTASRVRVRGVSFSLTDSTAFREADGRDLAASDLQVEDIVRVRGLSFPDGETVALRVVRREVSAPPVIDVNEVLVTGFIQARSAATLTVGENVFELSGATTVYDEQGRERTRDDLRLNTLVEVKGAGYPDGRLVALRITLRIIEAEEVQLRGTLEAVEGSTAFLAGNRLETVASTRIVDRYGRVVALADLQGAKVKAVASKQPDGRLEAGSIEEEAVIDPIINLAGPVEAIDGDTVRVLGRRFLLRTGTVYRFEDGTDAARDAVTPGATVEIKGERKPGDIAWALRIRILETQTTEVALAGEIEDLSDAGDTLYVASTALHVAPGLTMLYGADGGSITIDDLRPGQEVRVRAEVQNTGGFVALAVVRITKVKASGASSGVTDGAIETQGTICLLDEDTLILDAENQPLSEDDLEAGQLVEVDCEQQVATAPQAGLRLAGGTQRVATLVRVLGASTDSLLDEPTEDPDGGTATALEDRAGSTLPETFALHQNYPNPFNPVTTVPFDLPVAQGAADVSLRVYNLLGQEVATLVRGSLPPGRYEFVWDARDQAGRRVASGVYLYRLQVGSQVLTRTMVLLK